MSDREPAATMPHTRIEQSATASRGARADQLQDAALAGGSALLAGRACRGACQPGHQLARRAGTQQRLAGRDRADRAGQIGTADLTAVPAKVLDRAARRARAARASGLTRQAFRPCKGADGHAALDSLLAGGHHWARRVSTSTSAVSL
jgi:hypothetical protein